MATIDYGHTIGGKGVGEGLPLRRASHLYDVEPERRYPTVLEYGFQGSQFQYGKNTFHTVPHLQVTFTVSPYINNHKADGKNFTRTQYFTIVRGQPVMAAMKNEATIGVFADEGGTAVSQDRTYANPANMASNGFIIGFYHPDRWQLIDGHDAGADADPVITQAEYDALDASAAGAPAQDDYKEVTIDDPVPGKRFFQLDKEDQQGYRASYEGVEDTNDQIATGGVNMFAEIDRAIFGTTEYTRNVKIDANNMFFGHAEQSDGFLFPSSGGAHRTIFYNEVDAQAEVTLPVADADADEPRQVKPLGNVTDVSAGNVAAWQHSAVRVSNFPTIGVMHTEIETTQSHKYHHFSLGTAQTGPRSVIRSAQIRAPFFNITKLREFINEYTPLTYGGDPEDPQSFNFTDESDDLSGMKVGIYGRSGEEADITRVNAASLLTEADAGYANLYYNFGAPFMVTDRKPGFRDRIKSDLFAQYTLQDAGILDGSSAAGTNTFDLNDDYEYNVHGQVNMADVGLGEEVIGKMQGVDDVASQALEELRISRIWQNRIVGNSKRNALTEGYRRQGNSNQTGGVEQLLADAFFMACGGANYEWASSPLPEFKGAGHDLGIILREAMHFGAVGVARFAVGTDV